MTNNLFSAITLDQNRLSQTLELDTYETFTIQAVLAGNPVGTLAVEVSNDDTNWAEADIAPVNGAETWAWSAPFPYNFKSLRLNYTRTSGTGTINAGLRGKTMKYGNRRVLGVQQ